MRIIPTIVRGRRGWQKPPAKDAEGGRSHLQRAQRVAAATCKGRKGWQKPPAKGAKVGVATLRTLQML